MSKSGNNQSVEMKEELIKAADIFQTSVDFIDKDHGELVDLVNRLWFLIEKNTPNNTQHTLKELKNLITYMQYHFTYEEVFMKKINYPAMPIHMNDHVVMLTGLKNVYESFAESKDIDKLKYYFQKVLKSEFLDHILHQDSITSDYYLITHSNPQKKPIPPR